MGFILFGVFEDDAEEAGRHIDFDFFGYFGDQLAEEILLGGEVGNFKL